MEKLKNNNNFEELKNVIIRFYLTLVLKDIDWDDICRVVEDEILHHLDDYELGDMEKEVKEEIWREINKYDDKELVNMVL